jgi:hypothetical protein
LTEYQSRRERREAEAQAQTGGSGGQSLPVTDWQPNPSEPAGLVTHDPTAAQQADRAAVDREPTPIAAEPPVVNSTQNIEAALGRPLTRRELRLAQERGADAAPTTTERAAVTPPASKSLIESLAAEAETEAELDAAAATVADAAKPAATTSATDASAPFTGSNLLSEPKTQSIVLTQVPEAVSLPTHTGEITTTGSITILSDSAEKVLTGSLDGAELDRAAAADAVTGAMSVVSPVSALAVIKSREGVAVVPSRALRRGWWQPWLVAIAGLAMLAATTYTTIIILNAIGG